MELPVSSEAPSRSWATAARQIRWDVRPFINGHYRDSSAPVTLTNVNPATEEILCPMAIGSAEDVHEATRIARERFEDCCWSALPAARRAEILMKLAELIVQCKVEIALKDTLEMGKPIQASLYDSAVFAPSVLRSCAHFAEELLGHCAPLCAQTLAFNVYEPRGVVAAITPWNFPIVNAAIKVGPALAAGNAVVLKPSEVASSSALKLAELAIEAGIPEGIFNVVPGAGATVGAALASHHGIDLLSFTGSTITGRKIAGLAGRSNCRPLLLECGGKSPQIVFDDVDNLDRVAEETVRSFLWNQGQVCSAHTRLIAHVGIKDVLLSKVVERASIHQPADPLDEGTTFGPLGSPAQRDRVKHYFDLGISEGAHPVLKGRIQEAGGCYVSPTVFDQVTSAMRIANEEIFGPILCVQSFKSEAEAIALANGTAYGLAATVWTRDLGRAKRLAHRIRAGHISVRTSGEEGSAAGHSLSHEPRKNSGFGAELGLQGLRAYSTLKAVTFNGS